MSDLSKLPGLKQLWAKTRGDPEIIVAVLDGAVDQTHPCFQGAALERLPSLVQEEANSQGMMSQHGTHITSVIFAQQRNLPFDYLWWGV